MRETRSSDDETHNALEIEVVTRSNGGDACVKKGCPLTMWRREYANMVSFPQNNTENRGFHLEYVFVIHNMTR